jgi:histidinol-phosphate aminotransferase
MINLDKIVRPNILDLKPYSSARDEFSGSEGIFLDANENPFGELNRYPDPYQRALKTKLAERKNSAIDSIFIGNGSDEVIDLAFRIFCTPGQDKALTFSPTYGMYDVSAAINNVHLIKLPLASNFQIDIEAVKPYLNTEFLKLIFICSPNNPTGNLMQSKDIEFILENFNGIVIIDEAYIDFAEQDSLISLIGKYNNLIVSQTFSKAWGLAAVRVGTAYSNPSIIQLFNKVKPPYNVSKINQEAALAALEHAAVYETNRAVILKEKERLILALNEIEIVQQIFPSDANFLLVKVTHADRIYKQLVELKIITRNRNAQVANCIRFSIGTPEENKQLIHALKNI